MGFGHGGVFLETIEGKLVAAFDSEGDDPASGPLHPAERLVVDRVDPGIAGPPDPKPAVEDCLAEIAYPAGILREEIRAEEEVRDPMALDAFADLREHVPDRAVPIRQTRNLVGEAIATAVRAAPVGDKRRLWLAGVRTSVELVPREMARGKRQRVEITGEAARRIGDDVAITAAPGEAGDLGRGHAARELAARLFDLLTQSPIERRMPGHHVAIEHVEVRTLGNRDDARIQALGERSCREVVVDGLRGAAQKHGVRPRSPESERERGGIDAFSRAIHECARPPLRLERRGGVHQVDGRAQRDGPELLERGLAAILTHVEAGRRNECEERARARQRPMRMYKAPDLETVAASGTAWRCARSTTARPATPSRRPAPTAPRAASGAPAAGATCPSRARSRRTRSGRSRCRR